MSFLNCFVLNTHRKISALIFVATFGGVISAQNSTLSFDSINEGNIKRELASFTLTGAKEKTVNKLDINCIPLRKCNDTLIVFEKGNLIYLDRLIDIFISKFDTSGHKFSFNNNKLIFIDDEPFYGGDSSIPVNKISAIRVMIGKLAFTIPENAYFDVYEPNICTSSSKRRINQESNWKVYQSIDEKRLYIYSVLGVADKKFEVTWIITNGKYTMRVLDKI
jgi:hypothetical protein